MKKNQNHHCSVFACFLAGRVLRVWHTRFPPNCLQLCVTGFSVKVLVISCFVTCTNIGRDRICKREVWRCAVPCLLGKWDDLALFFLEGGSPLGGGAPPGRPRNQPKQCCCRLAGLPLGSSCLARPMSPAGSEESRVRGGEHC